MYRLEYRLSIFIRLGVYRVGATIEEGGFMRVLLQVVLIAHMLWASFFGG